jgi:hypothetical protein
MHGSERQDDVEVWRGDIPSSNKRRDEQKKE